MDVLLGFGCFTDHPLRPDGREVLVRLPRALRDVLDRSRYLPTDISDGQHVVADRMEQ
jgi:hypothetical protein